MEWQLSAEAIHCKTRTKVWCLLWLSKRQGVFLEEENLAGSMQPIHANGNSVKSKISLWQIDWAKLQLTGRQANRHLRSEAWLSSTQMWLVSANQHDWAKMSSGLWFCQSRPSHLSTPTGRKRMVETIKRGKRVCLWVQVSLAKHNLRRQLLFAMPVQVS